MADQSHLAQVFSDQDLFTSATQEQSVEEQPTAPAEEQPTETPPPAAAAPTEEAHVPSWRLREEAERARAAEERAAQMEQRLQEIAAHLQQQQQPQKAPDFFENPDAATQMLINRSLQPLAEATHRQMMYMGKMVASAVHGNEAVAEAENAFMKAVQSQELDPADYDRVVNSPNRYDAAVQWHKRQSILTSVGNDPNAWFEQQLATRMADPEFQAKLLDQVRGTAAKAPALTKLPPSLSRTTAAASNREAPDGDMSDKSLFAYAMKR